MKVHLRILRQRKSQSRLSFLLFLGLVLGIYIFLNLLPKNIPPRESPEPESPELAAEVLPEIQWEKNTEIIQKGLTVSDILEKYEFSSREIYDLGQQVKPVFNLANIIAGHEFILYRSPSGQVMSITYEIDKDNYLQIDRDGQQYTAEIKPYPYEIQISIIWGSIKETLESAINEAGEKPWLAISLAEIFAWDIDFGYDLQEGDTFKIIFEKKYLEGQFTGYGHILAAEFANWGKTFQAFRFTYPDTHKSDYFDYNGNSLRKEFLKSPLTSPRITSRFSHSRLHPVRKVYRPHYGVDYGAPVGTKVYATADGIVTFAGWNGGSGRMLRIRHKNGYETMYLHLRRFAPGIKRGAQVTSNQYIAQVGASGEVNGPHLDYRIKHHGTYINPLAARFDPVEPLRKEFMSLFQTNVANYKLSFDVPAMIYALFNRPAPIHIKASMTAE